MGRAAGAEDSLAQIVDPGAPGFDPSEGAYGPPIDDANPKLSVPDQQTLNRDPLAAAYMVMELSRRAEQAEIEQDHAAALRYFEALGKAVPDRAFSFAKQCIHHQKLGQTEQAIAACRRATSLEGAKLADHLSYASLLLATAPAGTAPAESVVAELDTTFAHLEAARVSAPEVDVLWCKLAAKLNDPARMRQCVQRLSARDPSSAVTSSYQFSLALLERDFDAGRNIIARAQQTGFPAEALEMMQRELEARRGPRPLFALASMFAAALAIAGAVLLLWASAKRRRRSAALA